MTVRAPEAYREIALVTGVLAAEGTGLTAILYDELLDTLRLASNPARLRAAAARALSILGELDQAGHGEATPFAVRMRAIHARTMRLVARAVQENNPKWIQVAAEVIAPIAEAWSSVGTRL